MSIQFDETLQIFIDESLEHLADIQNNLLAIEAAGADIDENLVNILPKFQIIINRQPLMVHATENPEPFFTLLHGWKKTYRNIDSIVAPSTLSCK